jgi:transposase
VDGKTHIVTAWDVTKNPTDQGQLSNMIEKTQETLRKKGIDFLADKGYYSGNDLTACEKLEAGKLVVSRQKTPGGKSKDKKFRLNNFRYDKESDQYTCPAGEILFARSKKETKTRKFMNKEACTSCKHRESCLNERENFRCIRRGSNGDIYDKTDEVFRENIELYKQRQQIVEHVFGTVKRTMNGGYFLLRTKEKIEAEVSLLLLGYNIKRAKSALGFAGMMEALDKYAERIAAYSSYFSCKLLIEGTSCKIRLAFYKLSWYFRGISIQTAC